MKVVEYHPATLASFCPSKTLLSSDFRVSSLASLEVSGQFSSGYTDSETLLKWVLRLPRPFLQTNGVNSPLHPSSSDSHLASTEPCYVRVFGAWLGLSFHFLLSAAAA